MNDVDGRVVGALVGLALGDALGAPVEHMSAAAIAERHPGGVPFYGEVTDDTEMAMLVARSLLTHRALDMEDVSQRLVQWHAGGGVAGPSTVRGIAALRDGEPWARAGSMERPSSGCLPRCMPVALALGEDLVEQATRDCCLPTHRHDQALAATVALNATLARLVAGAPWEPPAAVEGEAGEVLALAASGVHAADSARAAIEATVAVGGDTDTAGAVAGALAGARWGLESLPGEWIDACELSAETLEAGRGLAALRREA